MTKVLRNIIGRAIGKGAARRIEKKEGLAFVNRIFQVVLLPLIKAMFNLRCPIRRNPPPLLLNVAETEEEAWSKRKSLACVSIRKKACTWNNIEIISSRSDTN